MPESQYKWEVHGWPNSKSWLFKRGIEPNLVYVPSKINQSHTKIITYSAGSLSHKYLSDPAEIHSLLSSIPPELWLNSEFDETRAQTFRRLAGGDPLPVPKNTTYISDRFEDLEID